MNPEGPNEREFRSPIYYADAFTDFNQCSKRSPHPYCSNGFYNTFDSVWCSAAKFIVLVKNPKMPKSHLLFVSIDIPSFPRWYGVVICRKLFMSSFRPITTFRPTQFWPAHRWTAHFPCVYFDLTLVSLAYPPTPTPPLRLAAASISNTHRRMVTLRLHFSASGPCDLIVVCSAAAAQCTGSISVPPQTLGYRSNVLKPKLKYMSSHSLGRGTIKITIHLQFKIALIQWKLT